MKSLSKAERAAKFSAQPKEDLPGLRSRGSRKLTLDERKQIYASLVDQQPSARMISLRMLREACQSSSEEPSDESRQLELGIWQQSIEESIRQNKLEAVPHMLTHIVTLTSDEQWHKLYIISLANNKNFHDAFLHCKTASDREYVMSVATMDLPLRNVLLNIESEPIARLLMQQIDSEFEVHTSFLQKALQHPATLNNARSNQPISTDTG